MDDSRSEVEIEGCGLEHSGDRKRYTVYGMDTNGEAGQGVRVRS